MLSTVRGPLIDPAGCALVGRRQSPSILGISVTRTVRSVLTIVSIMIGVESMPALVPHTTFGEITTSVFQVGVTAIQIRNFHFVNIEESPARICLDELRNEGVKVGRALRRSSEPLVITDWRAFPKTFETHPRAGEANVDAEEHRDSLDLPVHHSSYVWVTPTAITTINVQRLAVQPLALFASRLQPADCVKTQSDPKTGIENHSLPQENAA